MDPSPILVECCRAGGRPAAARRAGLEFVEKLLTRISSARVLLG
jgi:hypothetical protein